MHIERKAAHRNRRPKIICSTKVGYRVEITRPNSLGASKTTEPQIKIVLDQDEERSGGGDHYHHAYLSIPDLGRILKAVGNRVLKDHEFAETLSKQLSQSVADLERIKQAAVGLLNDPRK